MRNPQHFLFDRHGDARLDFLRRHARRLQDDLDLRRRDIGERIDRQAQKSMDAGADQDACDDQHQQALSQ